jgi:hypothetical protein
VLREIHRARARPEIAGAVHRHRAAAPDGRFAETREQLGGYFLVDAENLDAALEIAERIPGAAWGTVEVRPVVELGGLPMP